MQKPLGKRTGLNYGALMCETLQWLDCRRLLTVFPLLGRSMIRTGLSWITIKIKKKNIYIFSDPPPKKELDWATSLIHLKAWNEPDALKNTKQKAETFFSFHKLTEIILVLWKRGPFICSRNILREWKFLALPTSLNP